MGRGLVVRAFVCALAVGAATASVATQEPLPDEILTRADSAVRDAFAFLYALPSDMSAAKMGSWVVDSELTTPPGDHSGHWRLVVSQLTDTGNGLRLNEMAGSGGTTPAQLAAAMEAMQKLESKISRAEAEASIEINVTLNAGEIRIGGVSDNAERSNISIAGAEPAMRIKGDWMRLGDRQLEIDYERWSPATLLLGFGGFAAVKSERIKPKESLSILTATARAGSQRSGVRTIAVTAQGNEEMVDRLVKEARWAALAALLN